MEETTAESPSRVRSRTAKAPQGTIQSEMDELSLEQALIDFEIANSRVIDLSQRLVTAAGELVDTRRALDETRAELDTARAQLEALRRQHGELRLQYEGLARSRSLRLAAAAKSLVNALRR